MARPRLAEKTCLLVGGTGGLGSACARRFLDEGARIVLVGLSPGIKTESLGPQESVQQILGDASQSSMVETIFRDAIDYFGGRIDILLHVAGISGRKYGDGPLHECSEDGWDRVLSINARSTFLTNREAVRLMRLQSIDSHGLRGTIVNVGSILSEFPSPEFFGTVAYAASKGAVRSMTLASAARYAQERIRFQIIEPGLIDTPMATRAVGDPAIREFLRTKQAMRGGPGLAEDVAEAALFLCEPASQFLTGTILPVDGGWRLLDGQIPRENSE